MERNLKKQSRKKEIKKEKHGKKNLVKICINICQFQNFAKKDLLSQLTYLVNVKYIGIRVKRVH